MYTRLRDEAEHRPQGPGQNASLASRQRTNCGDPFLEPRMKSFIAVQHVIKCNGESLRSLWRLYGIAKSDFLKREKKVCTGLYTDGALCNLGELSLAKKLLKL
jgi:hypothetical protein